MKKVIIILSVLVFLLAYATPLNACHSGGEGSSSCSYTYSAFFGLISETHSVTCKKGYYACCTESSGKCIKEGTPQRQAEAILAAN